MLAISKIFRGFDVALAPRRTRIAVDPPRALPSAPVTPIQRLLDVVHAADESAVPRENGLPELSTTLAVAGYRPLSQRDVNLSRALNSGYLLRVSLEPLLAQLPRIAALNAQVITVGDETQIAHSRGEVDRKLIPFISGRTRGMIRSKLVTRGAS